MFCCLQYLGAWGLVDNNQLFSFGWNLVFFLLFKGRIIQIVRCAYTVRFTTPIHYDFIIRRKNWDELDRTEETVQREFLAAEENIFRQYVYLLNYSSF